MATLNEEASDVAPSMNYSPIMLAADVHNLVADKKSITMGDVGDFFTKGSQAALASGMASLLNTGIDVANFFGSRIERINTTTMLQDYDSDVAKYYREHQDNADMAGFLASSLIPGLAGMKGFNMLKTASNTGTFGKLMSNTIGLPISMQEKYLAAAASDIVNANTAGNIFGIINTNKALAIAAGFADQALQAAAFETAVAVTFKNAPIFDKMSWSDMGENIVKGALVGGVIGGGINAFLMKGQLGKLIDTTDAEKNLLAFTTEYGKLGAAAGDKMTAVINSLEELASTTVPSEVKIKIKATEDLWQRVASTAADAANGDKPLANQFVAALKKIRDIQLAADSAGGMTEVFKPEFRQLLELATKFGRISESQIVNPEEIFYIGKGMKEGRGPGGIFSDSKPLKIGPAGESVVLEDAQAYRVTGGDPSKVKVGSYGAPDASNPTNMFYPNTKAAFDAGVDVFFNQNLSASINPRSKLISPIHNPTGRNALLFDTKTGAISTTAFPVVGDIARNPDSIQLSRSASGFIDALSVDGKVFRENDLGTFLREVDGKMTSVPFDFLQASGLQANARYVYMDMLADEKNWRRLLLDRPINSFDIPQLEAVLAKYKTLTAEADKKFVTDSLQISQLGSRQSEYLHPLQLEDYLIAKKRQLANRLIEPGTSDLREIAQKLNVEVKWLETDMRGADGAFLSVKESKNPRTVRIDYDTTDPINFTSDGSGAKHPIQFPGETWVAKGEADLQARIQTAQETVRNVAAAIWGEGHANLPEITSAMVKAKANSRGAGSSFWGAANANYESLAHFTQTVGKETKILSDRLVKETADAMTAAEYQLLNGGEEVAREMGATTAMLRRTSERYFFHPTEANAIVTEDLYKWLKAGKSEADYVVPDGWQLQSTPALQASMQQTKFSKHTLNEKVASYLQVSQDRNAIRVGHSNAYVEAIGKVAHIDPNAIYVPPIDTRKYPFIAFVREPVGRGGASGDVGMITARDEAQLQTLMAQVDSSKYQVISKKGTEDWFKAKGDYDYQLSVHENSVNTELKKKGILGEHFPESDISAVVGDWRDWHMRMETKLARTAVEAQYGQQIAELRVLGKQYTDLAASKIKGGSESALARAPDPFEDYIKSMMNISRKNETPYTLWRDINEFAEQGFTTAFNKLGQEFRKASTSTDPNAFEKVNETAAKFGLGAPFSTTAGMLAANQQAQTPLLIKVVGTMNAALAATVLRLDFINPIINIISTPILYGAEMSSIFKNAKDPKIAGRLGELISTAVPGSQLSTLTPTKLIARAIGDYFGSERDALIKEHTARGWNTTLMKQHADLMDESSSFGLFLKDGKMKKLEESASKMVELGATITRNNWAEEFTRFISARSMQILGETAGLSKAEINAYTTTFVNRVQGNYIAAQRPILFQGALGQAISLFQTYQFNMLQQAFRHVENGDKKTLAIMGGLQSTLYGMQGLPAFNFLNTQLIGNAAGNPTHADIYTGTRNMFGKDVGDFMLHGAASNLLTIPVGAWNRLTDSKVQAPNLALYTRGDINPRYITVIPSPTNPLDWPAVSATVKAVTNILSMGSRLANGGAVGTVLTQGLEHNGISRPLTGLAQLVQGYSTTGKGGLIASNTRDAVAENFGYSNDLWLVSAAGRLMGAKPLHESIALDALYKMNAYKAKDLERIGNLGEAVKTTLVAGGQPTEEQINDFVTRYAAAGGNVQNFNRFMIEAMKSSNTSVVNAVTQNLNNPRAKNMLTIMGNQELPDYRNQQAPLQALQPTQ